MDGFVKRRTDSQGIKAIEIRNSDAASLGSLFKGAALPNSHYVIGQKLMVLHIYCPSIAEENVQELLFRIQGKWALNGNKISVNQISDIFVDLHYDIIPGSENCEQYFGAHCLLNFDIERKEKDKSQKDEAP